MAMNHERGLDLDSHDDTDGKGKVGYSVRIGAVKCRILA